MTEAAKQAAHIMRVFEQATRDSERWTDDTPRLTGSVVMSRYKTGDEAIRARGSDAVPTDTAWVGK